MDDIMQRYDSEERQHYLLKEHYTFKLKPRLLYTGELKKTKGWSEMPHSHNFCEIIFIVEGQGTSTIDGVVHPFKKGDIIIYNPGVIHSEYSSVSDPTEIRFFAFDKFEITDLAPNFLLPPEYDYVYSTGELYDVFCDLLNRIILEFQNKDNFYVEISQNIARTMLMYIFRIINNSENDYDLLKSNRVLNLAVQYINNNFKNELSLEAIAAECYVNKYYLSHLFTRYKNMSIGKYIFKMRIDEAKKLLQFTNNSMAEISDETGFNDPNYFSRAFKKETAQTPLQYRKSVQKAI